MAKEITYLAIQGRRDAYGVDDLVEKTLTVGQLKEILEDYDDDLPVVLNNDNGYTYGKLDYGTIAELDYEVENSDDEEDE